MVLFLSVSLPFIFYFVWFVFLVCVYYVYLYMGQVPELKLMMMLRRGERNLSFAECRVIQ